jgi:CBS domain containing-hemolysin-like protein
MSLGEVALIIVGLVLLAASSALFSGIETALFSLQPYHMERLRKRRASLGNGVSKLLENPRRLLSALLLADTLVNLPLIVLGLFLLNQFAWWIPAWAAVLILTVVIVFPCDLMPKLLALAQTYRLSKMGIRVMGVLIPIFDPIARVLQRLSEKLADLLTPKWLEPIPFLSEDELETLVALSAEAGTLHETESEMIQEIIKLGDKTAKDCMTPRVETFAVPDDLTHEELIPRLRERRFRRVLVYGETPDDIGGILDVEKFLLDPSEHYTEQLAPPSYVSETMKALDLLRGFLKLPQGMGIVVDEHGGFEGVVTLADLVEEIISDAVPDSERALYLEPREDGSLLASGSARLEDIVEATGIELEAEGIDTIGGLVFNRLGTIPRTGTTLEIDGYLVTIQRISRKRVEEVLIQPPAEANGETEEESVANHRGEEKSL